MKATILPNKTIKEYAENSIFTEEIVRSIENWHNLETEKIYRNVLIKYGDNRPLEFDVLMVTHTPTGVKRLISVELKEIDVPKVIEQLIARRKFVDYSYACMNTSVRFLVDWVLNYVDVVREHGLGFFAGETMVLPSKHRKREIEIELEEDKVAEGKVTTK